MVAGRGHYYTGKYYYGAGSYQSIAGESHIAAGRGHYYAGEHQNTAGMSYIKGLFLIIPA
ncbi:hypothetical protein [Aquimarina sp. AU119]|uniref:hypothetical protein n=1 Tax=Aquimarina sp. AU119 TaxID=2108528 RepID=UPI00135916D7|nr:hypothetical protein [Aquimarina sp. AU119]